MKIIDGTKEFQGTFARKRTRTDALIVHHAAALYPQATGLEDARTVAYYHGVTKQWGGIGYHEVLVESMNGGPIEVITCGDPDLIRAHVADANAHYFGISCLTNFDKHPNGMPEEKWVVALAERLRYWKTVYPKAGIKGHKDVALKGYETDCPGRRWNDWKGRLFELVEQPATVQAKPAPKLVPYRVTHNGVAVRNKPGTYGDVMYRLGAGKELRIDWDVKHGTAVKGPRGLTRTWLHLYEGGYISAAYALPK